MPRVRLSIRGGVGGYSGYESTVRSFLRAFADLGIEVGLIDFPEWSGMRLPEEKREAWLGALAATTDSPALVQFCMPYQMLPVPGRLAINFTMFELDRIPGFWLEHSLRHDLVIVPEESSRRAWLADGFPEQRIRTCPLGVDSERFRPGLAPLPLGLVRGRAVAGHRTRFLNVSAIQPRKNLMALLGVWLEATRPDDDAVLIVKLSHSGLGAAMFLRDLHFLEERLGRTRDQAASLLLIDPILSDAEMPGLYAAATHYWSMSRGEGWDQPMTEAAASGLRLIAPDHTAYRAYLDPSIATMLPAHSEPASRLDREEPDPTLYRSFFSSVPMWWEPDRQAAIAAVRAAIDGRDAPRASARERMRQFSWQAAARRLCAIVDEAVAGRQAPGG